MYHASRKIASGFCKKDLISHERGAPISALTPFQLGAERRPFFANQSVFFSDFSFDKLFFYAIFVYCIRSCMFFTNKLIS